MGLPSATGARSPLAKVSAPRCSVRGRSPICCFRSAHSSCQGEAVRISQAGSQAVFIVGLPRSGTTLLREALSSHPEIALTRHESHFIPSMTEQFGRSGLLWESDLNEFVHRMRQSQLGQRAASLGEMQYLPGAELLHCAQESGALWSAVIEDVCRFYAAPDHQRATAPVWGDKTPMYIRHLPLLRELFPHCIILGMVREPGAQVESEHRHWRRSKLSGAIRWMEYNRVLLREAAEHPDLVRIVRYEDLVTEPTAELRSLEEFIGLTPLIATNHAGDIELRHVADSLGAGTAGRATFDPASYP